MNLQGIMGEMQQIVHRPVDPHGAHNTKHVDHVFLSQLLQSYTRGNEAATPANASARTKRTV